MRAPGEMEVFKIKKVIAESPTLTTLLFTPKHLGRWSSLVPGQFLMVWDNHYNIFEFSMFLHSYMRTFPAHNLKSTL